MELKTFQIFGTVRKLKKSGLCVKSFLGSHSLPAWIGSAELTCPGSSHEAKLHRRGALSLCCDAGEKVLSLNKDQTNEKGDAVIEGHLPSILHPRSGGPGWR